MNQLRTVPLRPKRYLRTLSNVEWLTVSNAAVRSRRMSREDSPLSRARWMSSTMLGSAVSVLHPLRNPGCRVSSRLNESICLSNWSRTHFSRALERRGRLEIGLRLLGSLGSALGFFGMGVIYPSWREMGTLPV